MEMSMEQMTRIRRRWPPYVRWPVKTLIFAIVVVFTLYPRIELLPRNLQHVSHMHQMIDPENAGLAPLEVEVRAKLGEGQRGARQTLDVVQQVVYQHLPYAWDWDVWGVADYMPTVAEALEKGREDCDGRAVVAASLLKRMGHEAWLVSDMKHVWVKTSEGETMSPGRANKSLVATPTGTQVQVTPSALANLGSAAAYGVAVFPLLRELIIISALGLLAMQPGTALVRRYAGVLTMFCGLLLVRLHGKVPGEFDAMALAIVLTGFGMIAGGWLMLLKAAANRCAAARPESPAAGSAGPC
jgi:hypothetical protein